MAVETRVRWSGLRGFVDRLVERLAREPAAGEVDEIARAIEGMSRRMELAIERDGLGPERLTEGTRELRGWLAWMAARENLDEYLSAVVRARAALVSAGVGKGGPVLVELRPDRHIYKIRNTPAGARVTLPTPMVRFDDAAFGDLAKMIRGKDRLGRKRVIERLAGE